MDAWSGEKLVIMAKDIRLGEYEDLDQEILSQRARPRVRTRGARHMKSGCIQNQKISTTWIQQLLYIRLV